MEGILRGYGELGLLRNRGGLRLDRIVGDQRRRGGGAAGEEETRGGNRDAEAEIGADHRGRREQQARRQRDTQPVGVETEIRPDRLADPEDGVVAADHDAIIVLHFSNPLASVALACA